MRHLRLSAVAAAVLAAATVAAPAPALARTSGPRTTGPDPYVVIAVTVTDAQLHLSAVVSHKVHVIAFRVVNRGKKPHNFVIGVVRGKTLKPGATEHLVAYFPDFGRYRFSCTVNCAATAHGIFSVNR